MRLLPVALIRYGQPPETTIFSSRAQAHVTHNNVLSDAACETLILTVQDLLDGRKSIDEATSIKCSDQALALIGLAGY